MDDGALIETYGNSDLPEGTPDRPLVTFALFAYNQERYIREAVEGAFAQTYSPLEIILSDDCSSDRTFEIMREMAREYRGGHLVRVRRNARNLGLIPHVNAVLKEAGGYCIVLAAGDDISLPQRSERLVQAMLANDVDLVHSLTYSIDCNGNPIGERFRRKPTLHCRAELSRISSSMSLYIGATGAISRRMIRVFGDIFELNTYEDLIFGFRAALLNGFSMVSECLVRYRTDVGISQTKSKGQPYRIHRLAITRHRLATLNQRLADLKKAKPHEGVVLRTLQEEILFNELHLRILTGERLLLPDGETCRSVITSAIACSLRRLRELPTRGWVALHRIARRHRGFIGSFL